MIKLIENFIFKNLKVATLFSLRRETTKWKDITVRNPQRAFS